MCCICEESTLGLQNIYWYPNQWRYAIRRAVEEGKTSGIKHKVSKISLGNDSWGWEVKRV